MAAAAAAAALTIMVEAVLTHLPRWTNRTRADIGALLLDFAMWCFHVMDRGSIVRFQNEPFGSGRGDEIGKVKLE